MAAFAQRATEILKRTGMFRQTGIYYSGEAPPQIDSFQILLESTRSLGYFDDIAHHRWQRGRLFALCALPVA